MKSVPKYDDQTNTNLNIVASRSKPVNKKTEELYLRMCTCARVLCSAYLTVVLGCKILLSQDYSLSIT